MRLEHEYWKEAGFRELFRARRHKWKLVIDFIPAGFAGMKHVLRESWTDQTRDDIIGQGYIAARGFHQKTLWEQLKWLGIPRFVKLTGLTEFDISGKDADGDFIYPQDSSITLRDYLDSSAETDFLKTMNKTKMPELDLKSLAMMGILAMGVLLGVKMLGVFRWGWRSSRLRISAWTS